MKITLLGPSYPLRGGISHYNTMLWQNLVKRHEVQLIGLHRQYPKVLFPGKTQEDLSTLKLQSIEHDHILDSIAPLSWWRTAQKIRQYQPDLLIISWWHPFFAPSFGSIAGICKKHFNIPVLYFCHNVLPHEPCLLDKCLLRFPLQQADAFIVHAEPQKKQLQALLSKPQVFVNPHPRYDFFSRLNHYSREDARKKLQLQSRQVILFFGFIRKYKGLDTLLQALLMLPKDSQQHLLLVGEFYEPLAAYEKKLQALQALKRVTIVDQYVANEHVGLYFKAADVFAAPYLSATQSGAIQVAQSFGLPVIASHVGGLPEVIDDHVNGLLVPPDDPSALLAALKEYFAKKYYSRFRQAIIKENQKFSWDHMVDTLETAYQNIWQKN